MCAIEVGQAYTCTARFCDGSADMLDGVGEITNVAKFTVHSFVLQYNAIFRKWVEFKGSVDNVDDCVSIVKHVVVLVSTG